MGAISHNHVNYQARLNYVRQLLADHLSLSSNLSKQSRGKNTKITPIQYEADCHFKYNNFVYQLSLPSSTSGDLNEGRMLKLPGCVPIPAGTSEFTLRLSNSNAEGMQQETRVQNEVGILTLAAAALHHVKPSVDPRVFGWSRANREHQGWILQELMPGVPLAEAFSESMSLDQKKGILVQMAGILKALQEYSLPESIEGWGGVTFDESGAIVSAPMTIVGAGPWSSSEETFRGRLKVALAQASANPYLQGWHANGVRERIDGFIEHELPLQFSHLVSGQEKCIIHGDFTTDNLLYDPSTGRITAVVDYDFSCVLHPAYEFFNSFASNGGHLSGWSSDSEAEALRNAKLARQFASPTSVNSSEADWKLAQAWEEELRKQDVKRPSTIKGIDKVADIERIFGSPVTLEIDQRGRVEKRSRRRQEKRIRGVGEGQLVELLGHLGF